MGYGQFIKCKHCGEEFKNYDGVGFAGKEIKQENKIGNVINCPKCKKRVNNSKEEFEKQIIGKFLWD